MANYGGFYKGDKKKPKKDKLEDLAKKAQDTSVFMPPTIIPKGKDKGVWPNQPDERS